MRLVKNCMQNNHKTYWLQISCMRASRDAVSGLRLWSADRLTLRLFRDTRFSSESTYISSTSGSMEKITRRTENVQTVHTKTGQIFHICRESHSLSVNMCLSTCQNIILSISTTWDQSQISTLVSPHNDEKCISKFIAEKVRNSMGISTPRSNLPCRNVSKRRYL